MNNPIYHLLYDQNTFKFKHKKKKKNRKYGTNENFRIKISSYSKKRYTVRD